eukprot:1087245-Lingulodinium_polyedra.AAC.2
MGAGAFLNIRWPTSSISRADAATWWQARAGTQELHKLAMHLLSQRSASTEAERAWAITTRQIQPIRNQLNHATICMLTDLIYNAKYLPEFVDPAFGTPVQWQEKRNRAKG